MIDFDALRNPEPLSERAAACLWACDGLPTSLLLTPGYRIKNELDDLDRQIGLRLKAELDANARTW